MALIAGMRLGAYEIAAAIGAGGMGEVYRARDTRLNRDVALKVLPELFAADPDRLARFKREAQVLASLNHPNIGSIHGFEESGGVHALVLELVEGPTLADRIAQGPMPLDEALPIARQIAEALEVAHEHGVIHRDLKPANVKVRPDGTVKVLDFGLAKAFEGDVATPDVSQSPTLSVAGTHMGVILGTAAYMAPEQAKGKRVDKRVDIWAFGCVLYEMLTGRQAFEGEDISEILASVIKGSANLDLLPAQIHPRLRELVARCLEKDPRKRFRDIGDVRYELEQIQADPRGALIQPAGRVLAAPARPMLSRVATIVVMSAIVGAAVWILKPAPPLEPRPIARFNYVLPQDQTFRGNFSAVVAMSPDGRHFVYNTSNGLYLRSIDELTARLIQGTEENLGNPFFSPDGQWVGFFSAGNQLKKIPIAGGTAVVLGKATQPFGATWNVDNTILFGQREGVMRVSANGGTPELVIATEAGEQVNGPQMLPDGAWVLFTLARGAGGTRWDVGEVVAHSLETGERKVLWRGGSNARYVPTGHLIYALDDALFAIPLDLDRMEVSGGPVPLVAGVQRAAIPGLNSGAAQYGLSDGGTLVYVAGGSTVQARNLVWVDRRGQAAPVVEQEAVYTGVVRISPDGRRIAATINDDGNEDIWIIDPARGARTRLTFGAERDIFPLWTRDGARVTFTSSRRGAQTLYWAPADGTGMAEPLTESKNGQGANSWSPDGRVLAFHENGPDTGYDLWILEPGKDPAPFLMTPFRERGAAFSPDGRWLAYSSDESGRDEVYVQPYPGPGGKVPISTGGGRSPRWSAAGRELFYRNGNRMMAVAMETSPTLRAGIPRLLFEGDFVPENDGSGVTNYDVAADGRFLMTRPVAAEPGSEAPRPQFHIVLNWFEALKRLAPVP